MLRRPIQQKDAAMKTSLLLALTTSVSWVAAINAWAMDWPQWRGPDRNGVSRETGLLQEWPKEGPKLSWVVRDAGSGYSTPSVQGARLFLMGNRGLDQEFVAARSVQDGQKIWETRVGKVGNPEQEPKFPAARSTPTVDGARVYALGSDGDLVCLEMDSGKVVWQKNVREAFGGKPGTWAYSESPLVDGDQVVCSPGGREAAILALDKQTGEVKWKTAVPEEETAAYSSAIRVEAGGVAQYVQMLGRGLVGVDAQTGKLLWRYERTVSRYKANIPTPVARGAEVFSAGAGTGGGLVRLKAANVTVTPEEVYFSPKLPSAVGGAVLVGDHLFGTGNAGMTCSQFSTGEVKWEARALGAASLCYADGRLYLHAESGEVALVEPSAEQFLEKGRFIPVDPPKRSQPMEKAWAYPVVANGKLYLRDQDMLWCYDIRK